MITRTRLLSAGLLLALGGCMSWQPTKPPALAVELPASWLAADAADAAGGGSGDVSLASWWQRFDDPLLARLIDRALRANTSVNGAQAALAQAQALRDVAAAALGPTLDASGSAQHGTAGGHSTGNRFQLGLSAQWAPDVFGARRAAVSASDAAVLASAATLADTQVQLAAEVALNYILLRSAQQRWRIASDNLASQQEAFQLTDWRQQAGLVSALEVDQARAAVAQTRAQLPALLTSIQQTRHALAVLGGQTPETAQPGLDEAGDVLQLQQLPQMPQVLQVPQVRQALTLDVPANTLRQRADVRAAEYQVAAALARVDQAQAQRYPSFAIGGSLGLSALTLGALTNGASVLSSLLASVNLPLFDGGAARAQVRSQDAALAQAQQAYRAAVLGALQDVENALVALRNDRLRLASLMVAADAASSAALLARQRYSSGLVDFQTVLETQRTQLSTQDGVVGASADVSSDHVRLFRALGGGWRGDPGTTLSAIPSP